jgi:hypothetical protein
LNIGGEPIELVAPLDQLILDLTAPRTGHDRWLFPGQTAGQPLNPKTLGQRLVRIGVTRAARVAALHDLIRQIPGPVLAPLIGYNPNFLADRAATLAVPWATTQASGHEPERAGMHARAQRGAEPSGSRPRSPRTLVGSGLLEQVHCS